MSKKGGLEQFKGDLRGRGLARKRRGGGVFEGGVDTPMPTMFVTHDLFP